MDVTNGSDEVVNAKGGFCHDPLWETDLLVNSSWPHFTDCFQNTVLVYIPVLLLWLSLPFYLYSLHTNGLFKRLSLSRISLLKMVLSGLLVTATFVLALHTAISESANQRHASPAAYLSYVLRSLSYAIMILVPAYERRRHVTTSSVGFTFWFFTMVCDIIPFYTKIMSKEFEDLPVTFCLYTIIFVFEILLFLTNWLSDNTGITQPGMRSNPEVRASFVSKLWFAWTIRTIIRGWRKELTKDDMYHINPRDAIDTLITPFERNWRKQMAQGKRKRCQRQQDLQSASGERESFLMGEQNSLYDMPYSNGQKADEGGFTTNPSADEEKQVRNFLLRALFKQNWDQLVIGFIYMLSCNAFLLLSPLVLSLLIDWANKQEDRHAWQGYALAFLMLAVQLFRSLFLNWGFRTAEFIGMHVKTTLSFAVYKKALSMTSRARQQYTTGEIINMISVDCNRLRLVMDLFFYAWTSPVVVIGGMVILYQFIGWAVVVGLVLLLLIIPVNTVVARKSHTFHDQNIKFKDKRLQLVNEALTGIKLIKLYAWEPAFEVRISRIRVSETKTLTKIALLKAFFVILTSMVPFWVIVVTFAIYLNTSDDNILDASKAFVTISYLGMLREPLFSLSANMSRSAQALVSIRRINKFLLSEDLNLSHIKRYESDGDGLSVDVEDATFTWDALCPPLLRNISLKVTKGSLCAVVGTVGSGKSSTMSALLNEMEMVSGRGQVQGSVAYVPQQAWIQNATVRQNIVFGQPFHQQRYQQILFACALERDLEILPAGDATEIGEKGINLSGGQKQRVSLARACYSQADVYVLDDPLSAVDSHVGKHIFNHVVSKQGLLKDKTCLLVTHGLHWLPMTDKVVVMESGRISECGTYDSLMAHQGPFAEYVKAALMTMEDESEEEEDEIIKSKIAADVENLFAEQPTPGQPKDQMADSSNVVKRRSQTSRSYSTQASQQEEVKQNRTLSLNQSQKGGKLVEQEKTESGQVRRSVYASYIMAAGLCPVIVIFAFNILHQVTRAGHSFWLSHWTKNSHSHGNLSLTGSGDFKSAQDHYLIVYGGLGAFELVCFGCMTVLFFTRTVAAARRIHLRVLKSVLRCPMSFFDTTPVGRIMNRFTKDISVIDDSFAMIAFDTVESLTLSLTVFVIITINTPFFLIALVPIVAVFVLLQTLFLPTSRQLKRLESVSRSPIITHLSESLSGAVTVRAYQKTNWFLAEMKKRLDGNTSLFCPSLSVTRTISFYLDILTSLVTFSASFFCILTPGIDGAMLGLSVTSAILSSASFGFLVRQYTNLETNIVCVERLKEYAELESEAEWIVPDKRPAPDWPTEGRVEFKGYKTRYRPDLDLVLKGITCTLKGGEKVGVVGRTGAGKSSMALSLFRLIEASGGHIFVDGVDLCEIGLHDLRSRLTILPQDPVLFYGSLRMNLDPIDLHTDDQLWNALSIVHLKDYVQNLSQALYSQVGEEGASLSVGQRQLVCLARALLKKTKILVLDEATAAVDMETDKLIQDTIRTEFDHCTVISIAHRLNTILDYDRVMVLDEGQIQEMDSPTKLLADPNSAFYAMAKDANLV